MSTQESEHVTTCWKRRDHGKYDCWNDEHLDTSDVLDGQGHVDSPSGWWSQVDLDIDCEGHEHDPSDPGSIAGVSSECDGSCTADWKLYQHYGSRWLVVRQDYLGSVSVRAFDTEQEWNDEHTNLLNEYLKWSDGLEDWGDD